MKIIEFVKSSLWSVTSDRIVKSRDAKNLIENAKNVKNWNWPKTWRRQISNKFSLPKCKNGQECKICLCKNSKNFKNQNYPTENLNKSKFKICQKLKIKHINDIGVATKIYFIIKKYQVNHKLNSAKIGNHA